MSTNTMSSTKRTLQESEIINDETFNIDQPAAKKQKQSGVFNPDALIATQLQNEHNDITMEKANEPHVTKNSNGKNSSPASKEPVIAHHFFSHHFSRDTKAVNKASHAHERVGESAHNDIEIIAPDIDSTVSETDTNITETDVNDVDLEHYGYISFSSCIEDIEQCDSMHHSFTHCVRNTKEAKLDKNYAILHESLSKHSNKRKILILDFNETLAYCFPHEYNVYDKTSLAELLTDKSSKNSDFIDEKKIYYFRPYTKNFLQYVTKEFYVGIISNIKGIANVIEYWNQEWLINHNSIINKCNCLNDDINGDAYNHTLTLHKWDEIGTDANKILFVFEGIKHYLLQQPTRETVDELINSAGKNKTLFIANCNVHLNHVQIKLSVENLIVQLRRDKRKNKIKLIKTDTDDTKDNSDDGDDIKKSMIVDSSLYILFWNKKSAELIEDKILQLLRENILPHWKTDELQKIEEKALDLLLQLPMKRCITKHKTRMTTLADYSLNDGKICGIASKFDFLKNNKDEIEKMPHVFDARAVVRSWREKFCHRHISNEYLRKACCFGNYFCGHVAKQCVESKHVLFIQLESFIRGKIFLQNELDAPIESFENRIEKYDFYDDITLENQKAVILFGFVKKDYQRIIHVLRFCIKRFNVILDGSMRVSYSSRAANLQGEVDETMIGKVFWYFFNNFVLNINDTKTKGKKEGDVSIKTNSNGSCNNNEDERKSNNNSKIIANKTNKEQKYIGIVGFTNLSMIETEVEKTKYWKHICYQIEHATSGYPWKYHYKKPPLMLFYDMKLDLYENPDFKLYNIIDFICFNRIKRYDFFHHHSNSFELTKWEQMLLVYKKYYTLDVAHLVKQCKWNHGLLNFNSKMNALFLLLTKLCQNSVTFTLDDVMKLEFVDIFASCNNFDEISQSAFEVIKQKPNVIIDGSFDDLYFRENGIIGKTRLQKDIVEKKLGLIKTVKSERHKASSDTKGMRFDGFVSFGLVSASDTMGDISDKLEFKHLVDYFGEEWIKEYFINGSIDRRLNVLCKTDRIVEDKDIKWLNINSNDKNISCENSRCVYCVTLDITKYQDLMYSYRNKQELIKCSIVISNEYDKDQDDGKGILTITTPKSAANGDGNTKSVINLKLYCQYCAEFDSKNNKEKAYDDSDEFGVGDERKCIHLFRSLMDYVNYEPLLMPNVRDTFGYDDQKMWRWWLGEEFCAKTVLPSQLFEHNCSV